MHISKSVILLILVFSTVAIAQEGNPSSPFSFKQTPEMKELLKETEKLLSTNKNKVALSNLHKYDEMMAKEVELKNLAIIEDLSINFIKNQKIRKAKLEDQLSQINDLNSQSGNIEQENAKLSRKTILLILLIIGLGTGLLFTMMRKLKILQSALNKADGQRVHADLKIDSINNNLKELAEVSAKFSEVKEHSLKLSGLISIAAGKKQDPSTRRVSAFLHKLKIAQCAMDSSMSFSDNMAKETQLQVTNLNHLIEEVMMLVINSKQWHPDHDGPKINTDLEEILPEIEIDKDRLRFSLYHFISNAYDAVWNKTAEDIKNYTPTITITSRKLPQFIQIRIKDNGVGIGEKDLKSIFEPFYSSKDDVSSVGIGLTKSYELITNIHKGELKVESELNDGTDFIIRFPLKQVV